MIAVMILGEGIAKTGIMDRFSRAVLEKVGTKESSVIGVMSLSVGALSGLIGGCLTNVSYMAMGIAVPDESITIIAINH
jgi:Na+/H+ antiporter NhaD/arsenite permease-like protein